MRTFNILCLLLVSKLAAAQKNPSPAAAQPQWSIAAGIGLFDLVELRLYF